MTTRHPTTTRRRRPARPRQPAPPRHPAKPSRTLPTPVRVVLDVVVREAVRWLIDCGLGGDG